MMTPEEKKSSRGAEWVGIGLALGTAVGLTMGNLAIGAGGGLIVGALIMSLLQEKDAND